MKETDVNKEAERAFKLRHVNTIPPKPEENPSMRQALPGHSTDINEQAAQKDIFTPQQYTPGVEELRNRLYAAEGIIERLNKQLADNLVKKDEGESLALVKTQEELANKEKLLAEMMAENQNLRKEIQTLSIRLDEHRTTHQLLAIKGARA